MSVILVILVCIVVFLAIAYGMFGRKGSEIDNHPRNEERGDGAQGGAPNPPA